MATPESLPRLVRVTLRKCYTPGTMRLLFLLVLLATITLTAHDTPKTMTKIETHLESPEVMAGSFSAKPKVTMSCGRSARLLDSMPDKRTKEPPINEI
jgi:hypothetical protein